MAERLRKKGIHWCSWSKLSTLKENSGIGFRDFEKFNIALLEKQGWRLLQRPNLLLSQVLKAKYFVDTDFLNARLHIRPSY